MSTTHGRLGTLAVARLGFGAMQLPGPGVFGPPPDRGAALAVLRRAVELGVNHIDTAHYYGPGVANALIREALAPYDATLVLVSKVGARRDETGGWLPWNRPADLRQGIEDNLRSLDTPCLGAVNLRLMGPTEDLEEQLAVLVKARQDGLIAGIGLSNCSLDQLRQALTVTDLVCVQNPLNVVDRAALPVLEHCAALGMAFVPFFPLGSGFGVDQVRTAPAVLATADRLGATPAQVALAWLLTLSPAVLLIPGTSSVAHLEENLAAGELVLDDEARSLLGSVAP